MLKAQVDTLTQKLQKTSEDLQSMTEKNSKNLEEIDRLNNLASNLYQEYAILAKEKDNQAMQSEIDK